MRIYDIHNQHPEWVENPTEHRDEIREAAHAYIWDFFKMGADVRDRVLFRDLNAIADNRSQIIAYWEYNGNPEAEPTEYRQSRAKCAILERVFRLIVRYLAYYGYALQYEDLEVFYNGRDEKELNFIKFEEWYITEPNANKDFAEAYKELSKILYAIEHDKQDTPHFNLGEETAKRLYKELKGKICCTEENFLWYFGNSKLREGKEQPEQIEWYGQTTEFAALALIITLQAEKTINAQTEWEKFKQIFKNCTDKRWDNLSQEQNKIKAKKKLPNKLKIESLEQGLKLLNDFANK